MFDIRQGPGTVRTVAADIFCQRPSDQRPLEGKERLSMIYKYIVPLFLAPLMGLTSTQAAVKVGANMVIYNGAQKEASVSVSNDDDEPFLVQAWVSRYGDGESRSAPEFIIAPALFRLNAYSENLLQIARLENVALPNNQESLFSLNIKIIAETNDAQTTQNAPSTAPTTTLKFIYRPATLAGDLNDAVQQLKWSQKRGRLSVRNDSGFNIVVDEVKINGLRMKSVPEVIPPFCALHLQTPAFAGDYLSLRYIDEFGNSMFAPIADIR